ncbi:MAG: response regulator [Longimicrobiales bacterium]
MKRILIVDDERGLRRAMASFLRRCGYETREADDGRQAVQRLRAETVDLVLCDLCMPEMDGIEVILVLRKDWPRVPVVVMSGGGQLVDRDLLLDSARTLGAHEVLAKPFGLDDLEAAVERALARATAA